MIGTRHTFASYFALAVDTILKVLWREGYARGPQELVTLTYNRIRRLERRFNALVARWRAGTLRAATAEPRHLTPALSAERRGRRDGAGAGGVGVSAGAGVGCPAAGAGDGAGLRGDAVPGVGRPGDGGVLRGGAAGGKNPAAARAYDRGAAAGVAEIAEAGAG